ncbi:MAG: hypothetical protein IVW51_08485 [Thermaceae bacterium]|nr:hypothetical protein [Thermaceae bacterium]
MPQVHTYLKAQTFEALQRRARARGLKLSELLREILEAEAQPLLRPSLMRLAGSWEGELQRPPQGELETRREL